MCVPRNICSTIQVFATFCGLGIHSVMSYEKILKANAKQSVALEVRGACVHEYALY